MDLAIVVVSYNVRDLLQDCLQSVFASLERSPQLAAQVWVVDNASADGSAAMVAASFPQVHLIASRENLGFARGNNLALRQLGFGASAPSTEGEPQDKKQPRHVLLLNPDTVVQEDALAQLVAFLDRTPGAGACGPQLSYPDGAFQHGAFRFPTLAQILFDFFPPPGRLNRWLLDSRLNGRYSRQAYAGQQPFPVDFVLGAALTARDAAIAQVGLLDEGYFMYCEEMDWQQRLQRRGWSIHCVPAARVVHVGGASTSQFRGPMVVALWRSRLRYFQRYHGPLFQRLARWLIRLGARQEIRRAEKQQSPDLDVRREAYAQVSLAAGSGQAG